MSHYRKAFTGATRSGDEENAKNVTHVGHGHGHGHGHVQDTKNEGGLNGKETQLLRYRVVAQVYK